MCLDNPVLLINIIGTGMYHDLQFEQWTSLAKARAIENEIYVIGCSHFSGEIPLAYVFDPSGRCVLLKQNEYGGFIAKNGVHQNSLMKTAKCMIKRRFFLCYRMIPE